MRPRRVVLEMVGILGLAFAMVITARLVAIDIRFIPSGSMTPQLQVGDRVMVSKLAHRLHEPNRGDIVVFPPSLGAVEMPSAPSPDNTPLLLRPLRDLGRWIGFVHPAEQDQDLIKRVIGLPGDTVEGRDGAVFINGHRLSEPYLQPDVVTSDFPPTLVDPGQLWMMGDNRGGSLDSRSFGTIPSDEVLGRAILRIWPIRAWAFI